MSKVLRFKLDVSGRSDQGMDFVSDVFARFFPNGRYALNRTEWRGKEPRSCAVTRVSSQGTRVGESAVVAIEVTYRRKAEVSFVGKTRYSGWQAMVPARTATGEFADAQGKPLESGASPVFVPRDVYGDAEFNDLDFGEFIEEVDDGGVKRTTVDEVMKELMASGRIGGVVFQAAHRSRPLRKILITPEEAGHNVDGFGTHVEYVPKSTPQLQHTLTEKLTQIMDDFVEGKVSIKNMGNEEMTFVSLSDVLVDCSGGSGESRFNVLEEYTSPTFLDDLAKHLMSQYEVEAAMIPGKEGGLVLRHSREKR